MFWGTYKGSFKECFKELVKDVLKDVLCWLNFTWMVLTLLPSLGRSSARTFLVRGLAIVVPMKLHKLINKTINSNVQ